VRVPSVLEAAFPPLHLQIITPRRTAAKYPFDAQLPSHSDGVLSQARPLHFSGHPKVPRANGNRARQRMLNISLHSDSPAASRSDFCHDVRL